MAVQISTGTWTPSKVTPVHITSSVEGGGGFVGVEESWAIGCQFWGQLCSQQENPENSILQWKRKMHFMVNSNPIVIDVISFITVLVT